MNKFFEYQDFVNLNKDSVGVSSPAELQEGSNIEQLKKGVVSYDYASFEKDAYDTENPKNLAPKTKKLGFVTANTSDASGNIDTKISIDLNDSYSIPGITLGLVNPIEEIHIKYFSENNDVLRDEMLVGEFSDLHFFNIASENVRLIEIDSIKTLNPYRFFGLYKLEFGSLRIFDSKVLVDASVESYYKLYGDTIEYDIMNADVFHEQDTEYLFVKKQKIVYKDENGDEINTFYVETGEQTTDNVVSIKAYDSVSLLEEKFLGGIYGFESIYTDERGVPVPFNDVLAEIFSGTNVKYRTEGTDDILVTGYIPICTRREAAALLCYGTNVRCVKDAGVLVFKPFEFGITETFTKETILQRPYTNDYNKIKSLSVNKCVYKKSNETVELFSWYLEQGENTMQLIEFSEPVWKIDAYEITGTDPDTGLDIISDRHLQGDLTFYHAPMGGGQEDGDERACNYCIVKTNRISNRVLIKGWKIIESRQKTIITNPNVDVNAEYDELDLEDVTITNDITAFAKLQFAIENSRKKQTIEVVEVERPKVGNNAETVFAPAVASVLSDKGNISINRKITSVVDDLSGVYKVVIE